jgi:FKBP-type peptidyl-prolyl cis-trans isomerase
MTRSRIALAVAALLATAPLSTLHAAAKPAAAKPAATAAAPMTDDEKALYSLGVILSSNIQSFEFSAAELERVKQGLADGALGKANMEEVEKHVGRLQELQGQRVAATVEREKAAGVAFQAKAAAEAGATRLDTGVILRHITEGTGPSPQQSDQVKVHYEGRFVDGKVFDSSYQRNEPATFPLDGVIPCWTLGVQQLKVGGKAQLVCPPDQAYGDAGRPPQMRGGATLVFSVELLEIVAPTPPAAEAASAAPAGAGAGSHAGHAH